MVEKRNFVFGFRFVTLRHRKVAEPLAVAGDQAAEPSDAEERKVEQEGFDYKPDETRQQSQVDFWRQITG